MKKRVVLILFFCFHFLTGQEDYFASQSRFMQKTNFSYLGINNLNKIGALYNSLAINQNTNSDNKYLFGVLSFDENKFSLSFDVNSFKMSTTDFNLNLFRFSYIK